MLNAYAELMFNDAEKGPTVLFRGATYQRCLSERSNNALRTYKGRRVYIAERRTTRTQKLGWQIRIEGEHHA